MYKGEADWTLISEVKNLPNIRMPIFGNGDIDSPQKALEYKNKYGVDGLMIGRAAIGYPWIFREVKHYFATGEILAPPTVEERVNTCKQHLKFSMEWKGERVGIFEMRNHYTAYFKGITDFKPFRLKLVEASTYVETLAILDEIIHTFQA
jgi:tRNA-dihydrouridine synthase